MPIATIALETTTIHVSGSPATAHATSTPQIGEVRAHAESALGR
jgi:hypothetical protein